MWPVFKHHSTSYINAPVEFLAVTFQTYEATRQLMSRKLKVHLGAVLRTLKSQTQIYCLFINLLSAAVPTYQGDFQPSFWSSFVIIIYSDAALLA